MELRPLRGLLLCVLATTLLAPSLGKDAVARKILGSSSLNIVDGEKAEEGRYQYACVILIGRFPICTGFLVHPKIVITAAHCFFPSVSFYTLACGGMLPDGSDAEATYTGTFVKNPSYVGVPGYHDVAMIVTDEASDLPLPIVSRDKDEFKHGRMATAIGWGETKEDTGLEPDTLKIARDIIPTDRLCEYDLPTLCGTSVSGRAAHGDSGGPLVIEGHSAEKDVVFGVTSSGQSENGFHVTYFTNLPFYLDKFIAPYVIEKDTELNTKRFPSGCPMNPTLISQGGVAVAVTDCNVTFVADSTAKIGKASIYWKDVTRSGSKVAFGISIDHVRAADLANAGFGLDIYEDVSLYVPADGTAAWWTRDGYPVANSYIIPGSGLHKVRIENTDTGYEIFEDGLKSAIVDIPFPRETVVARFNTIAESAGLSYEIRIDSIRMAPAPSSLSISEEITPSSPSTSEETTPSSLSISEEITPSSEETTLSVWT